MSKNEFSEKSLKNPNVKKNRTWAMMNPIIRQLSKVDETTDSDAATYMGIAHKVFYFIILTIAAVGLPFLVSNFGTVIYAEGLNLTAVEIIAALAATALTIIMPIILCFVKKFMAFTGSVYCIASGYILGFLIRIAGDEYGWAAIFALAITIIIVAVMAFIYAKGIVKVNQKFKTVITVLFSTMIIGSLLTFVGYFIPGVRDFITAMSEIWILGVISSVIFIIIAALFLLIDFDQIQQTVEKKLPKKYEWFAAAGLVFTIIWLYFKVLELIIRIKDR